MKIVCFRNSIVKSTIFWIKSSFEMNLDTDQYYTAMQYFPVFARHQRIIGVRLLVLLIFDLLLFLIIDKIVLLMVRLFSMF